MSEQPIFDNLGKQVGTLSSNGVLNSGYQGEVFDSWGNPIGELSVSGSGFEGLLAGLIFIGAILAAVVVVGIPLSILWWFYKGNKKALFFAASSLAYGVIYAITMAGVVFPLLGPECVRIDSPYSYTCVAGAVSIETWNGLSPILLWGGIVTFSIGIVLASTAIFLSGQQRTTHLRTNVRFGPKYFKGAIIRIPLYLITGVGYILLHAAIFPDTCSSNWVRVYQIDGICTNQPVDQLTLQLMEFTGSTGVLLLLGGFLVAEILFSATEALKKTPSR